MQNKREDGVFLCAATPGRVVSMWAGRRETQGDIEFVNVGITARRSWGGGPTFTQPGDLRQIS